MYDDYSAGYYIREQRFRDKFPLAIVATLAIVQMLTTFTVFALEIGHNILHLKLTNLFVGFWVAIPFTFLWISMFAVVCCCRRKSCATNAVVQNVLGLISSGVLIGINVSFIRQPNRCFFTEGICQSLSWTSYISDPIECLVDGLSSDCGNTRISLIVGQLACGILMIITCLVYITIYSSVCIHVSRANRCQAVTPTQPLMVPFYRSETKPLSTVLNHHHLHREVCAFSSHPCQESVPTRMAVGISPAPLQPLANHYLNHCPAHQYTAIYSNLGNERF